MYCIQVDIPQSICNIDDELKAIFNGSATKISNDIESYLHGRPFAGDVRDKFLSTFDDLDIDRNSEVAMMSHYTTIRSRFHCGRNWYKSLGSEFIFTPLCLKSFAQLSFYLLENGYPADKLFADCYRVIGDWSYRIPFETSERNRAIKESGDEIFSTLRNEISPVEFKVFGRPQSTWKNEANIFSADLIFGRSDEEIKKHLEKLFYRSKAARSSKYFNSEDMLRVRSEIEQQGSLSHGYRKMAHLLSVETVLRACD